MQSSPDNGMIHSRGHTRVHGDRAQEAGAKAGAEAGARAGAGAGAGEERHGLPTAVAGRHRTELPEHRPPRPEAAPGGSPMGHPSLIHQVASSVVEMRQF